MNNQVLLSALDNGVLTLTMNRPERLNALNTTLIDALRCALEDAALNPEVKVVVLAGAGAGFSAGGDLSDMAERGDAPVDLEQNTLTLRRGMEVSRLLHDMPKPTIARLHGAVAGAGMSLALACDLRIAGTGAKLTPAFAKVGLSGDFGGAYFLTKLIGSAQARQLCFMSPRLPAEEALRLGLYTRVVPDAELAAATTALAESLAAGPTIAFGYIKKNINLAEADASLASVLDAEAIHHVRCAQTHDHKEAARSFMEKRAPVFRGC